MYPVDKIIDRGKKFMKLRREELSENVDRSWELAAICEKLSKRLYARGHKIIEYEYGTKK